LQDNFDSWSEEGEQIQTGMWQAFKLDEPELGTPKGLNQPAARPSVNLPRPGQPQGAPQPPVDENAPDRWDMPIQERIRLQQAQAQASTLPPQQSPMLPPQPAPSMPAPSMPQPAMPSQTWAPQPAASAPMPAAPAAPAADRWDMPIQDRNRAP